MIRLISKTEAGSHLTGGDSADSADFIDATNIIFTDISNPITRLPSVPVL